MERGKNREDYGKVIESGWMERDRGGVDKFHEGSKYLYALSLVNISEQGEGDKETDYGKEYWGEVSFMPDLYVYIYLTGAERTIYRVKEADDD